MGIRSCLCLFLLPFFPRPAAAHTSSDIIRAVNTITKAGLAWPNGPYVNVNQFESTGKVQWYYTWSPNSVQSSLEFVPMLWGEDQLSAWQSSVNSTIQSLGITHALGFNEPEQDAQSNLTPADAASLWKAHLEPLKAQGVLLGSPAPSSAPAGKQWLLDWLDACDGGCTVDFVALHWYDINSTAFISYLEDFHNTFQKPLWVTEWACQNYNAANEQCSLQNVVDFMNATQAYMDITTWVERYAWFGAMENMQGVNQADAIMTPSGKINALGEQYIGAVVPNVSTTYTPGVVDGGYGSSSSSGTGPQLRLQLSCTFTVTVVIVVAMCLSFSAEVVAM
ncbi:glycosyl hydrolase catalytic core-domain-containing protein [Amylocystis lapponica]|nr:glycosyl hydrolase catalytic core-domain-containing protein [Amylocystis lapponica]